MMSVLPFRSFRAAYDFIMRILPQPINQPVDRASPSARRHTSSKLFTTNFIRSMIRFICAATAFMIASAFCIPINNSKLGIDGFEDRGDTYVFIWFSFENGYESDLSESEVCVRVSCVFG